MSKKYTYFFGNRAAEGAADMKNLLGGKGANLAEMTNLGIPVPPGFTISTEACAYFYENGRAHPPGLWDEVLENLKKVEAAMGSRFGDPGNPLLLSVRSGARVSMPGMMDTVLNLGLNDSTLQGLAKRAGNERFAFDSYRRFINMFGDVVLGMKHSDFEEILHGKKKALGVKLDTDLEVEALKELVAAYKEKVRAAIGQDFPTDPLEQLKMAIDAVFASWNTPRAVTYRKIHGIPHNWGTAVNVQAMVFGNLGETSATGVAFTRDPGTGDKRFFGEFLINAQGEDVVAGIRTPMAISELKQKMPGLYKELEKIYRSLETHYRDMQDIEFTIQEGRLFMLQTRSGKRTAAAAVRIAVEMVKEGLISRETALLRIEPEQLDQLLHPTVDPKAKVTVLAKGLPASPGAAVGKVVFTAEEAERQAVKGEKVVLVREETSPEDIGGMNAAQGILTARGGMTSHAAVVARGMGKCCVAGVGDIRIDEKKKQFNVKGVTVKEGNFITLNGSTGEVLDGKVNLVQPELGQNFATLMEWADAVRTLKVRTNADTPHDAQVARDFGAEGIGLCRTEHMFFEGNRIEAVREMIVAGDTAGRRAALAKILPMQKGDFKEIFRVMKDLPVTIRLLDPPLHEFLPHTDREIEDLSKQMGVSAEALRNKVSSLREFNPMLGHRGCRLGISFPEIYEMQAQAIFEAACELAAVGFSIVPEVMIPLVGHVNELSIIKEQVIQVADRVMKDKGVKIKYLIGTMIELPRACLTADQIARDAEFFSFGTNDLTQTVFGLSRDDAGTFLPYYVDQRILPDDPFVVIDRQGVGALMSIAVEKGRRTRPDLKLGICGEHGGEPSSVEFCHLLGLEYVSCSPFRVPIARLAAAQAALKQSGKEAIPERDV
ncbi:MAG: pyruvate, phosphate dikinase [Candidatus Tectomicrobia bacterium]|uniref:Pyruvate, phosphate dikinase n=1 Tax=Tectimicrobiota bacterium TaxID=2528274 RepID=A0A932LZF2_UNCTE|nr:pyruvate, phosphate dikinase [Candidatus Tectomicrobia bacterium]